jgi:hypothetical protein
VKGSRDKTVSRKRKIGIELGIRIDSLDNNDFISDKNAFTECAGWKFQNGRRFSVYRRQAIWRKIPNQSDYPVVHIQENNVNGEFHEKGMNALAGANQ